MFIFSESRDSNVIESLGFTDMSGDRNDSMVSTELVVFKAGIDEVMVEHCVARDLHQA